MSYFWYILNSANGTFVNKEIKLKKKSQRQLHNGDEGLDWLLRWLMR